MLGADVSVLQAITLFVRVLQDLFRFRSQRQFDRGRDLLAQEGSAFNLFANRFDGKLSSREKASRQRLIFTHQSQQQMLGLNRMSPKLGRFVTREEDDSARLLSIAFEH